MSPVEMLRRLVRKNAVPHVEVVGHHGPVLLAVADDGRVLGWAPASLWELVAGPDGGWGWQPVTNVMQYEADGEVAQIVLHDPATGRSATVAERIVPNTPHAVVHADAITRLAASARAPFGDAPIALRWA